MNDTLQTALAWFGGLTVIGYSGFAVWLGIASVLEGRRLEAERAELRARRAPLTELDITSADFDAELITLIEGDEK
jgi:hypothetical protein